MENVALNKPVQANAQLNATSGPELAVDGSYALDSRWRTPSNIEEHWLEIDLQGEYEICGAALYMGDATGWPINNLRLEYWKDSQWHLIPGTSFTNNEVRDLSLTFDPVTTTKVRLFSNEKAGRGIRLKEIEIYAPAKEVPGENPDGNPNSGEGWNVENGCYLTFANSVTDRLQNTYYTGKISFDYLDEGNGKIVLSAATHDVALFGDYSVIASIDKTGTGDWIHATVQMEGTHIVMNHEAENGSDLIFAGDGRVKNVSIAFTTAKPAEAGNLTESAK